MSMGEENAAEILKQLEPRQVQRVGLVMSTMNSITKVKMQNVFVDFISAVEDQTSLNVDPEEYLRTVLIAALGEEKAIPFIDRIFVSDRNSGLNSLKWLDGRVIADVIRNEHPQIIATILIHLESEQAAEAVSYFSADKRAEVLLRMCNIDTVKPEAMSELGKVIEKQLIGQTSGRTSSVGGVKCVADVINFLDGSMEEEVIEKIKDWDEELGDKIRDKMFVFENITDMDDRSVQTLLRDVNSDQLKLALKGTTETTKEKIFANMSKRAADLLREDLEVQGPVKVTDVEKSQKDILAIARNLAEDGKISLGSKGGEEMI
jgi:flagellar motor switch protein FliG